MIAVTIAEPNLYGLEAVAAELPVIAEPLTLMFDTPVAPLPPLVVLMVKLALTAVGAVLHSVKNLLLELMKFFWKVEVCEPVYK